MSDFIIGEKHHRQLCEALGRLCRESNAKLTFLVDKNGQQIASHGDATDIDPTALASLTAGNIAAAEGLAQLIGEKEFGILFHEGEKDNLHINVVDERAILVLLFDERSSLGLVRLRVKQASTELADVLKDVQRHSDQQGAAVASPFAEITDEDIDALFG